MHVLVVTQYFYPESFKVNDLVVGLQERGHKVTVFTGLPNYPAGQLYNGYSIWGPYRETYAGSQVWRVPLIPRGPGGSLRLAANYLSFAGIASLLIPFVCRAKYDAIFVYQTSPVTVGLPALVLKFLRRIPILFWVQDSWPESLVATGAIRSPFILGLMGRFVKFIYKNCDRILVQSRMFVSHISRVGGDTERVDYLPNWPETFYQPADVEQVSKVKSELPPGFNILFGGNIGVAQSFDTILRAAELTMDYPGLNWIIVGDGRDRPRVQEEILKRGLENKVFLLGSKAPQEMPQYFSAADVLLVTLAKSPVFEMTVPSKLASYFACQRPVLGAMDGEGADVIKESGSGLVGPSEDFEALSRNAIKLFNTDSESLIAMGRQGHLYGAVHFSRERLLDKLDHWLTECVRA